MMVNLLGSLVGFAVEINPFTAMAVGFLGLPGAALVVALRVLIYILICRGATNQNSGFRL